MSAIDSQTMEQHEYMDRARQYRFDICNKILILKIRLKKTSMHSSRMRTARLLPVSPSMHCAGGVSTPGDAAPGGGLLPGQCLVLGGGMSASGPGGCLPLVPGGVCLWSQGVGCLPLAPRGVSASGPGGCLPLVGGGCIPALTGLDTPLWTEWQTQV